VKTIIISIFMVGAMASLTPLSLAQELSMPNIRLETNYVGPYQVPTSATTSIPPHVSYKNEGYDFKIMVSIVFQDSSAFADTLYGIVCIMPDYSVQKIYFSAENFVACSPKEYCYSFPIRTKIEGWIKVYIAAISEMASDTDVRFYRNTSNKESIYLRSKTE
jgi:hypothetical protein